MNISKKIARKIVFPTMMGLGIDKLIRIKSDNSIINVMYHGVVLENSTYFSPRHITKQQFEKHLMFYKKNFDIISTSEAFHYIQNGIKLKKKTLTISFDDGFQNNLNIALPLLEQYDINATFFISSICTQEMKIRCLWPELIAALYYFYKDQIITLKQFKFTNLIDIENNINLTDLLKSCSYSERERLLEKLVSNYNLENKLKSIPTEVWNLMTKDELIQLSKSKVIEIGSHGHLHYNLGNICIEDANRELLQSKNLLEKTLDIDVNMIAYPDGSYNEEVKNVAQKIGYLYQMAVNYTEDKDTDDLRIMNRYGISNTTTFESNMIFLSKAFNSKGIKTN